MRNTGIAFLGIVVLGTGALLSTAPLCADEPLDYKIELSEPLKGTEEFLFLQSRAAAIPGDPPRILMTTQETGRYGAHPYGDMYQIETTDLGKTWTKPRILESLRRVDVGGGYERAIGDFWPKWHTKTGVVLGTGKTFNFRGGHIEDKSRERVSYSVYDAKTGKWSGVETMKMPRKDHAGFTILEPNAGCHQRVDLPDGDILLPVRYRRGPKGPRQYVSIVARCGFDGKHLRYKKHGTEHTIGRDRGLYEPSLGCFDRKYYLTMRADHSAFVAVGTNGIDFSAAKEWKFDDGTVLGSYNTQQHFVTHSDGLFLVYTRRGANNDHIMRHRAPLFIARVDPERACVLRNTERVLIPENNATLGNFGVCDVNPTETWVVTSEFPRRERRTDENLVIVAKILWNKPNALIPNVVQEDNRK